MALCFKITLQSFLKSARLPKMSYLTTRCFSTVLKPSKLCKLTSNNVHIKRTFFNIFRKPSAEKLKVVDNIPDEYQLIYRNGMNKYIIIAQVFATVTLIVGVILTGLYSKDVDVRSINVADSINDEQTVYIATLALFWTVLYLMVQRLPIRIYSFVRQEKYIFVFYGNVPFTLRRLTCLSKDITKLEESGVLPWKDDRYEIDKQQRVIMLEHYFRRPADLNIMLGYQKAPEDYN